MAAGHLNAGRYRNLQRLGIEIDPYPHLDKFASINPPETILNAGYPLEYLYWYAKVINIGTTMPWLKRPFGYMPNGSKVVRK